MAGCPTTFSTHQCLSRPRHLPIIKSFRYSLSAPPEASEDRGSSLPILVQQV